MRRSVSAATLLALAFAGTAFGAGPATAEPLGPGRPNYLDLQKVVSDNPVDWTPHVLNGTVWAMARVGSTVVVGGDFTQVADSKREHTYQRTNLFAFDLRDGTVRNFAPSVDGTVYALAAGPDGTVYAGGAFTKVGDDYQRGITRLRLDGSRVDDFHAYVDAGEVRALAVSNDRVYAGGTFAAVDGETRRGLARVDAATGRLDSSFDARLSGPSLRRTWVYNFDLSPDGTKLAAIGYLLTAGRTARNQIAMFDVSGNDAELTGWYTDAFEARCQPAYEAYLRQVKFSPDGSYIVVTTTGGTSSPTNVCDAAARFDTAGTGNHEPVWIQHTGGNSLFAVDITTAAVYLGGHQEYMDNPQGHKIKLPGQQPTFEPGPGAVERPGIGAVDPGTGKALAWNPTRIRGAGVRVFLTVPQGLLVGSDTDQLGHEYHGRIGLFPPG